MRASVQELEALGWRAFWIPAPDGHVAMTHAGFLLSCTERISVLNDIARIWSREPRWTQGAALLLYAVANLCHAGGGRRESHTANAWSRSSSTDYATAPIRAGPFLNVNEPGPVRSRRVEWRSRRQPRLAQLREPGLTNRADPPVLPIGG